MIILNFEDQNYPNFDEKTSEKLRFLYVKNRATYANTSNASPNGTKQAPPELTQYATDMQSTVRHNR